MATKDRRADPDIDDEYDFSQTIPNPYAARFAKGHRTRISRNLEGSRLGIALTASCDGKELRVHLSNGDEIRSTLVQYTLLDEAEPELLRDVQVRDGGRQLYWPRLDVDMNVWTLIGVSEEDLHRFR